VARALLVAIIIAAPSFIVPDANPGTQEISLIIGGLIAVFVLFEYGAAQPGLIDFRFAPPYNRARFAVFTFVLLLVTFYTRALANADPFSGDLIAFADRLAAMANFSISPVALVAESLAPGDAELQGRIRGAAALAIFAAGAGALLFIAVLWLFRWPTSRTKFHLWANLPTFSPTSSAPVERRLYRSGYLNIIAGIVLPFIVLALAARAGDLFDAAIFHRSLTLVWASALWATGSALLVLRGAALLKIGRLVAKAK
jgi:hypothetical protein